MKPWSRLVIGGILLLLAGLGSGCGDSGSSCVRPQVLCEGQCADLASDRNHCGTCGTICLAGQYCAAGVCVACNNQCMLGTKQCASATQFQECGDPDLDTCMEWDAPESCPAGQDCYFGECQASCDDECSRDGSQLCDTVGQNGYHLCGEFDEDDCLDLGPLIPCPADQGCDNGQCSAGCQQECAVDGQRQCAAPPDNGFETCSDHDSDPCLEWGGLVLCPAGETCSAGVCSSSCTDECSQGERECQAAGYRQCDYYDPDPCLDWSGVTDCAGWQSCDPTSGLCVADCTDECADGVRQCATGGGGEIGFEICAIGWDADPCTEFGNFTVCGAQERCENGACLEDCQDECGTPGARTCDGGGFKVCGRDYDADSCLEWSSITQCTGGEICSGGQCSLDCTSECTSGQRECFGAGWRACEQHPSDPTCWVWGAEVPCGVFEICEVGTVTCVLSCSNGCQSEGARRCTGDLSGYETCSASHDPDPCLEWGTAIACPGGQVCRPSDGQCVLACSDGCGPQGSVQCSGAGAGTETCQDHDVDGCLEWGGYVVCPGGESCSLGVCSPTCSDECSTQGEVICDPVDRAVWRLCDYIDADACLDLSSPNTCNYGHECVDGAGCQWVCDDECALPGERRCSGSDVEVCANHDPDECLEWGFEFSCNPVTELCVNEVCVASSPPATVLISEILYNDDGIDGEHVFIELFGPPQLSLDGFTVEGINGANGDHYMTIDLTGYTIPDDGHFLIADEASVTLLDPNLIDMYSADADLQQGPDNVLVRWADSVVVDALGYEAFDPVDDVFLGEGDPAPSADNVSSQIYSLTRTWLNGSSSYADTDDNAFDFRRRYYPSPGSPGYGLRLGEYAVFSAIDSTPVVDTVTGVLYVSSLDFVDAVQPDFSTYVWYNDYPGSDKSSPALSADGQTVYVGIADPLGFDSGLHALDTLDGWTRWVAVPGVDVRSSPAVDPLDGALYFGTRGGGLVAIDPSDGSDKWTPYFTTDWIDSSPAIGPIGPSGAQVVVFGVGGIGDGRVVALRTADGGVAWEFTAPTGGCHGSPAIGSDGTVYATCDDGYLYAIDGATGSGKPGFPVQISYDDWNGSSGSPGFVDGRSPVVAPGPSGDQITVTSSGLWFNFFIVDSSGAVFGPSGDPGYYFGDAPSSVTVTGDGGFALVWGDFVGAANWLDCYDPDGFVDWYDFLGLPDAVAWITGSPNAELVGSYGLMYVGSYEGLLYAYWVPMGLLDSQGAFPKFRANESNTGARY